MTRADRVIDRIRTEQGATVLLFGHREVLRILAVRWIRARAGGRSTPLAARARVLERTRVSTDLTEPVIHAWNGRVTVTTSASVIAPARATIAGREPADHLERRCRAGEAAARNLRLLPARRRIPPTGW